MNYHKIYESLVERGKTRNLECYTESHHIVPRCMGGLDDKENLVDLTPEEHYLAHQLLVKMHPNNHALVKAASMMIPNRPSNKMYGWLRRRFSEAQSISQSGQGNSQHGTKWITDGKNSKKISYGEDLPSGWQLGRSVKYTKPKNTKAPVFKKISTCKHCIEEINKENALYWHAKFLDANFLSIREFVRSSNYDKSHVSFIKMLKKYIPEFNPEKGKKYVPIDRASERA